MTFELLIITKKLFSKDFAENSETPEYLSKKNVI